MKLLEVELKETRLTLYEVLIKLDKIKKLLLNNSKISKKQILKIIDGDINGN